MRTTYRTIWVFTLLVLGVSIASAQQFNLVLEAITNPPSTISTRDTVPTSVLVINLGPGQSSSFGVGFRITNGLGTLVFSDTVTSQPLPPNPSGGAVISASRRWHPSGPGTYRLQTQLINVGDVDSLDNKAETMIAVVPGLLSRAEAIAMVEQNVIQGRPNAQRLALYLHNRVATDSLVATNAIVRPWDSSFVMQVAAPSYLLWIDNEPEQFWCHSATFCFVDATTGALTVREAHSWPVINEIEHPPLTYGPNRVRGNVPPPATVLDTYTPVATSNTRDCALIIVGQNQEGWDSTALINDVARIKETINGVATGPQVSGPNIRTVGLGSQVGATKAEVEAAIAALKDSCDKLYVYYVGHGSNRGMGLRRGDGNGSEPMSWREFAEKLLEANPNEVNIVIMACSSGAAVDDIVNARSGDRGTGIRRLKGTIIVSAPPGVPTTGTSSGSPFHRAMNRCSKDISADLNGDGRVSLIEAMICARDRNDTVRRDGATAAVFGDGRQRSVPTPTSAEIRAPGDGGGSLTVEVTTIYYDLQLGDRPRNDSLRSRRMVCFTNPSGSPRRPNRDVEIVCVRYVKQGRRIIQQETVLLRRRMNLASKERFCFGPVPDDCGIVVREVNKTRRDDEDHEIASLDPPDIAWPYGYGSTYIPGEYIFADFAIPVDSNHRYATSIDGPPGWGLAVAPSAFQPHGLFEDQLIVVTGKVPDTVTAGALITAMLIDLDTGDTVRIELRALIYDSLAIAIGAGDLYVGRALDQYGDAIITGGVATLRHTLVRINQDGAIRVATDGEFVFHNSMIGPDEGSTASLDIAGLIDWSNSAVTGSIDGVHLLNAKGVLEGGAITGSKGNGISGRGDLSGLRMGFMHIDDVAGVGLAFDSVSGVLITGLTISDADVSDVAMQHTSDAVLRDCSFNPSRVQIDPTSTLIRQWTTHYVVVDSNGNPEAGAIIEIRDRDGNLVAIDTVGADGFSRDHYLVEWTQTGAARTARGPYSVRVSIRDIDTIVTHDADEQIARIIVLNPGQSGIRGPSLHGMPEVRPNPVSRVHGTASIAITLDHPASLHLRVHDLSGRVVYSHDLGRREGGAQEIQVPVAGLASGVYLLEVQGSGGGRATVARMVVE